MKVIPRSRFIGSATAAIIIALASWPAFSPAATPSEMLASYATQAGASAQPERGQQLFTTRHGREWSCSSCHGAVPVQPGKHAATGKPIGAMAVRPMRSDSPTKRRSRNGSGATATT